MGYGFGKNEFRWDGGASATDGVIYCISSSDEQVLSIDPLGEYEVATKKNMEEHPEELGFLFQINYTADTASNRTYFDCAATKFGEQKVLEIVACGLYPFMIAALCKERPLSVIYLLLRQVPSLIKSNSDSAVGNLKLKRKRFTT